ncbi:hypothetical protein [Actinosynnema sp. NPDC020468]|uniref:hypothetical protein n=1 Tax=Actinosynnema sp. NPDC020468 TaxID=3154488 RepID=UPI0033E05148
MDHGRSRTLFGELLRERGQTAEEFSEYANAYAHEHHISATLSVRHVHRLTQGRREDGKPLGALRAGTRRLLEELFDTPADVLLTPVIAQLQPPSDEGLELRARLAAGRRVDLQTVALMQQKLDLTRVIDRRLGATSLTDDLCGQISFMWRLLTDVVDHPVRTELARVLVDASTLAGWQSLDQGRPVDAWQHYDRARGAARVAESPALDAYACAGQAVVLLDVQDTATAVELTRYACGIARNSAPRLLSSWLTAAHGEALAAAGEREASLRAFEEAARTMPVESDTSFLVFDHTHLDRWRGSALARLGDVEAVDLLSRVLDELDPTFTRAETALRVDLSQVLSWNGNDEEAMAHAERARLLATQVGSARQRRRLDALAC